MTQICIISDTHRQHRALAIPECDILIHCGDFCTFRNDDNPTLEDADRWFAELPAKHIVLIGGNHDFLLEDKAFQFSNAIQLEDNSIEIEGLKIYGSPWCPMLSGFAYYASDEHLAQHWEAIPSGIDILVTHTPPHGLLDLPTSKQHHLGCPLLRHELDRIKPRLHAFGHIHASHGSIDTDSTRFINAAVVGGRIYEVRHPPTVVTL